MNHRAKICDFVVRLIGAKMPMNLTNFLYLKEKRNVEDEVSIFFF